MSTNLVGLIHTFTLMSPLPPVDVAGCVAEFFDIEPELHDRWGDRFYRSRYHFASGLNVLFTDGKQECKIDISGDWADRLTTREKLTLYQALQARATRVDVAVDGANFTPKQLIAHCGLDEDADIDNARTKANRNSFGVGMNKEGSTVYFGAPQSKRMLRVYNRRRDKEGNRVTRTELQLRKEYADLFFVELLIPGAIEKFGDLAIGFIRDFIDFIQEGTDKNKDRRALAPFWAEFIGSADRIKTAINSLTAPLEIEVKNVLEYVRKNAGAIVFYVITLMSKGMEYDAILNELFSHGNRRMSKKHRYLLRQLNHHPDLMQIVV